MTENLDLFGDAPASPPVAKPTARPVAGDPENKKPVGKIVQPWTPDAALQTTVLSMPPVMSTSTPRHGRWADKSEIITPVLEGPKIRDVMGRLGYGVDPLSWE